MDKVLWLRLMTIDYDIGECVMNFDNLERISVVQAMRDLPIITKPINAICKNCQFGNQVRNNYKSKEQCCKMVCLLAFLVQHGALVCDMA